MEISIFYAVTMATRFMLIKRWWSVGKDKKGEAIRRLGGGAYASFFNSLIHQQGDADWRDDLNYYLTDDRYLAGSLGIILYNMFHSKGIQFI